MEMISVIIPCYNVSEYLERCVASIVGQTYQKLEIILVNDGSTDGTGELCEKLAFTDSRIKVVHKENGGLSDARNAGINVATGEFYSFVDGDDYLELDAYEVLMNEMQNPKVSLVSAGIIVEYRDGSIKHLMSPEYCMLNREEALKNLFSPTRTIIMSSCNKLFRKKLFVEKRYKKGIINEDMEILPRLLDDSDQVVLLNKLIYHYVRREGSITESAFSLWKYQGIEIAQNTVKFCKEKYPGLVPYAYFYKMDSLNKMYQDLIASSNRSEFRMQEYALRIKIVGLYLRCMVYKKIRNEYGTQIKNMGITSLFGVELVHKLVSIKQKKL